MRDCKAEITAFDDWDGEKRFYGSREKRWCGDIDRLPPGVQRVIARCRENGVNPGYALSRDYPEHENGLLVAITERRTRAQIDRLAEALGAAVAAERGAVGAAR